jgi:uncharacterized protein
VEVDAETSIGLSGAVGLGRIPVADTFRTRLLGLSRRDRPTAGAGLLFPHCSSVHTFGMRFDLDVFFLDEGGRVIEARRAVPPRRVLWCRGAAAVLEIPAGKGGEIAAART